MAGRNPNIYHNTPNVSANTSSRMKNLFKQNSEDQLNLNQNQSIANLSQYITANDNMT